MTPAETLLWQKIENFEIDEPGIAFKFTDRLARENGWSPAYAKRVVAEYKKFLFLCCVSEHGVTPSDPVDQAWHLHLTYTRSYWINLCKDTLEREIHHNPTKGGKKEAEKFNGFYTSSHKLYSDKFGIQPPADIWQDNHTRFSDINFQRVNIGRYWLIKKPRLTVYSMAILGLLIACAIFIQATDGILTALLVVGIAVAALVGVYKLESNPEWWKSNNKRRDGNGCTAGGGCSGGDFNSHHGHNGGHDGGSDSGCGSGCSGCSSSGCSGCGGSSD